LKITGAGNLEGGGLVFNPTGNRGGVVPGADTHAKGLFVYGGGADFPITNHLSLRTEYRCRWERSTGDWSTAHRTSASRAYTRALWLTQLNPP